MSSGSSENPHAGTGAVVLDIGGEIGALVISTPGLPVGVEIEICPAGRRRDRPDDGRGWWDGEWRHVHSPGSGGHSPGSGGHSPGSGGHAPGSGGHAPGSGGHAPGSDWPHVGVVARRTATGVERAAVFPGLREGRYELWLRPHHPTALTATVRGGTVGRVEWPLQGA
jgi:hypothetical protein